VDETGVKRAPRAEVLFDSDCGFCRWSLAKLLAWDRRARLRPVAIQSEEGRRLLAGMSDDERMASWHLVLGGSRYSAGAAFAPLLRVLPLGGPLSRLSAALPGCSERGYGFVARHRGAIGRLISDGAKRRADKRIAARASGRS
jgi:predicted DCC family thiol-disulfide oxidoreductase YuxK